MFCSNCGEKIEDGSVFCPFCGANLAQDGTESAQAEEPQMQWIPSPEAMQPRPVQQPVQQPAQQPVQQPVQQPTYQQPVQQPTYQQPVQQPTYQQPVQQPVQHVADASDQDQVNNLPLAGIIAGALVLITIIVCFIR